MAQSSSQAIFQPFKYKDLRIYSSTEWLAGNKKKYRQVFEQGQVTYIYVELSLINKLYDREPWEAKIMLRCYRLYKGKKEVCSLQITRQISKHDHILFIREGWGHKVAGSFWKKGKYCWEAYCGDQKLAVKYFYIEDVARLLQRPAHSALKVNSVAYFEGDYDQTEEEDERLYYTQFSCQDTRYVFVELTLDNRLPAADWHSELFIKFYNNARELKGEVVRLQKMKRGEEQLILTAGWGSNVKGSWRMGEYSVEIIFQDHLLAQSKFTIGENFEEGMGIIQYPGDLISTESQQRLIARTAQGVFNELNALVGLKNIKKQIYDHTQYIKFLRLRNNRGFNESESMALHSVFTGNPGTGKTTVARMLGSIYHHLGILSKGHVHEVDRVDLVGEFIGQTAPKVREAIEKARGGVLFIDEAYSLARSNEDSKDFGREVIELLVKEMSQPNCDFMVVAAGYPDPMNNFIQSNPGLQSRFKYYYEFEDFSLLELKEIADKFCSDYEITLSHPAKKALHEIIQEAYRNRDDSFGNARYIGQLLERAKINMGIRIMNRQIKKDFSNEELSTIRLQDIKKLKKPSRITRDVISVDEGLLQRALEQLDELIGLHDIKQKIHELVEVVKFRLSQRETVTGSMNMHTVLVGNPGTGKTTVTRILANIYKALGILEKGHIVETDRQGLVAGYVGQTALKTAEIIKKAQGGVLFIDEAYALNKTGASNDFGDEAIQVLLKQMEDNRGNFFVFVAGYPEEMDAFLKMNPGLKSRFDHYLHFEDFTEDELRSIAQHFVKNRSYKISSHALKALTDQLTFENDRRDKHFGNARRVRTYVNEIIKQQNLRLSMDARDHSTHYATLIKKVDVQKAIEIMSSEYQYARTQIGFTRGLRS